PVFPDDAGRGSSYRLSQTGSASLHLLPGAAGSSDQDERQRRKLHHLPDRHAQTDQEQDQQTRLLRRERHDRGAQEVWWESRRGRFLHVSDVLPGRRRTAGEDQT
ncbi:hypothetical protein M9458_033974, partial [Cirrhinus mrigala]